MSQYGGLSVRAIAKELSVNKKSVIKWKSVPMDGVDCGFKDSSRANNAVKFSDGEKEKAAELLERDCRGVVRVTAEDTGMSKNTVYRVAEKYCTSVPVVSTIEFTEREEGKREDFAEDWESKDASKVCFVDHTVVYLPPTTANHRVFRRHASRKPVPTTRRYKKPQAVLVLIMACSTGIRPVAEVHKRRLKRKRAGEENYGFTWEKLKVNAERMKTHLVEAIFPFMRQNGLTTVFFDNAPCQQNLRPFIEEHGFKSPGFAAIRVDDECGFPASSPDFMLPDATVNNAFKREWSRQDAHKLCQVQRCCERVADILNERDVCSAYVAGFSEMCAAIRQQQGGKSKFIR